MTLFGAYAYTPSTDLVNRMDVVVEKFEDIIDSKWESYRDVLLSTIDRYKQRYNDNERITFILWYLYDELHWHSHDDVHYHGSDGTYFWSYTIDDDVNGTQVTVVVDGDTRSITSNALPNHETWDFPNEGNPNAITAQDQSWSFTTDPVYTGTPTPAMVPGVWVNGVKFQPGTAERAVCDNGITYNIEAVNLNNFIDGIPLWLDSNNAHVQPWWEYHYHGIPEWIVDMDNWEQDLVHVGFAADGHMMYYSKSGQYTTSYVLWDDEREGVNCVHDRNEDIVFMSEKTGSFAQDWEQDDSYGDLDQCNGMMLDGEYIYLVTDEYPYVPRCLMGEYTEERWSGGWRTQWGQGWQWEQWDRPPRQWGDSWQG